MQPRLGGAAWRAACIALLLLAAAAPLHAGPLAPAARAEIDALLARLQASGCRFERNGSWYAADAARAHLLRKLEYLERHAAVDSAEQFVERAASGSSVSGRPYRVQCGDAAPLESRAWLLGELRALRAAAARGGR